MADPYDVGTRTVRLYGIVAVLVAGLIGCDKAPDVASGLPEQTIVDSQSEQKGDSAMSMTIESPAFANNESIPARYTDDGANVSPELKWSGVPEGAKELALIGDDPDAPSTQPWVHWVIYKIPPDTKGLPQDVAKRERLSEPAGAFQGKNSWKSIGYRGPAPPPGHGVHHYHFKLYALDTALDVEPGLDKAALLKAMQYHIRAQGELVGTYQR